jgi:hypothetical protein
MDNGYEQEPIGKGRVRFTVHPATFPRSRGVPLLFGGIAGVSVVVGSGGPAAAAPGVRVLVALLAAVVAAWAAGRIARSRAARRDRVRSPGGSFVASPTGIEAADLRLPREELNGLAVRNPLIGRGAPGVIRASYALCIGATVLAGGMSEAVARGLLEEVRRILDADQRRMRSSAGSRPSR